MSPMIIVITIIVIANDVGDNFKYTPIIVFRWYFLLPPDPSLPSERLQHMASIASRKGRGSKDREKVLVSPSPGSPNLLPGDVMRWGHICSHWLRKPNCLSEIRSIGPGGGGASEEINELDSRPPTPASPP